MTRKLVVTNAVSLDGHYTGPGDDVMALELDPAFDEYNAERLRAAGGTPAFAGPPGAASAHPPDAPADRPALRLLGARTWKGWGTSSTGTQSRRRRARRFRAPPTGVRSSA